MSILEDGTLHGLNPFPIFTSDNFILAMILFIAILIFAFTSVSSYFFEREKGIGVAVGKKDEKGYSRWCKDKEMKKAPDISVIKPTDDNIPKGGIPIYNNGKEVWVDTGGYHNMIIGSTGSGKSQGFAFPYINIMAKAGESMIITDPKGELYTGTAKELEKRGYNIVLLNFRDPEKGNCWNPFSIPYKLYQQGNKDKAIELLEDLAKNILYDESSKGQDPFWENTSADYFAGLAFALFQDAKEEEVNINSINYMATIGENKIGGTTYIKEYFSNKPTTSTESIKVNSTITAPNETKGSILSVFNQKIQLFSSRETLSEMLSHSDFDMEDIGRKKTAVFIVIQDEKKTYHSLVTIFLKQCYETLVRVAQENPGGKLKYATTIRC
jgi:type IV secretion system protein VirD4